jgi:hypothetical protein
MLPCAYGSEHCDVMARIHNMAIAASLLIRILMTFKYAASSVTGE